jgi:hypothetical protein
VNGCPAGISVTGSTLKNRTLTVSVYVPSAGRLKLTASGLTVIHTDQQDGQVMEKAVSL